VQVAVLPSGPQEAARRSCLGRDARMTNLPVADT
jgi:hypothetical protein